MAIVRPRRPRATSPSHSSPESRLSTASSSARSPMSVSKVVSLERDLAAPRSVSTGESSRNSARAFRNPAVRVPKRAASSASSARWSWPSVRSPSSASRSAVLGPMPGTRLVGAVENRSHASSRPIATSPLGLPWSLQHFATSREGPTPAEIVMPVASRTSSISSRSTRSGFGTPVRSAYASSSPIGCRRSRRSPTIAHTFLDVSR